MVAAPRPEVEIRAMRREDLPAVSALENASYEFPWSQGIFADCLKAGHPCWVLRVDGETAGYGILSVGAGEAHVLNVCIGADWRGRGLGRHLLRRLLDIARWNGAERVFLEVRPSNPVAKRLYDSIGFREIGRRPRYYPARDGREDAIVMELDLASPLR
ncbi:ribosomal protein S18-alanine N-acetyltransferase [Fulvimonas soli]|jgi:ribosomal-protein-alanine N-acetyltransferase|uniref:[Ribosomal protein bS18]-alanine N-acetyltransferase n=1 Tax=Fulvimonas soli TaxID=155197 RepID=A0A316HVF2_9GAMM|nr:ribosomal protein S18-alanine N-acetyltransferase [Fulvimonas soli]PWK84712.1 [SSU ribosomal protein S18P]-alanine acetyltransferase [Fulvimonas soli]TNY26349.1 ribosomal-protein-alanine N-acetyltransferase [Fulvimonas soli]